MSDYGVFESINGSEGERKIASRDTQRKLDAAIDDVKRQYGAFLFASRDGEEWNDRVALCKNDMIKTVNSHIVPVTGVMRRIVKACKDDWRRQASGGWGDVDVDQAGKGGKSASPGSFEHYRQYAHRNGLSPNDRLTADRYSREHGIPLERSHDYSRKHADKTGPELKPEGDWEAYLKSVDENSQDAVDNCFKEGRYYYADNGIGAAPEGQTPGTGLTPSDPIAQAAAAPVGIPGIQASRYFQSAPVRGITDDDDENAAPIRYDQGEAKYQTDDEQKNFLKNEFFPGAGSIGVKSPAAPVSQAKPTAPAAAAPGAPTAPAAAQAAAPAGGGGAGDGGGGGGGGAAERPMTSGPVTDGGRPGAENGNNDAIKGKSYIVQEGDTLTDIAQRGFGDMNKYQDLAKANGLTNPDKLTVGQELTSGDTEFGGNNNTPGNVTNPIGGGADKNPATADAGPSVQTGVGGLSTANGFAGGAPGLTAPAAPAPAPDAAKVSSLAVAQYMDWCDSFGFRRASINNLDIYAKNLNDQAYFEIASALTDPSSPIYRTAAPSAAGGNSPAPQSGPAGGASQGWLSDTGWGIPKPKPGAPQQPQALDPMDLGAGAGAGFGGSPDPWGDMPGFGVTGRKRTAAPDYLQKADEALTNLLNQKAEEFQETIQPLQQALQTVQQAEAAQQAMNPMGVQPPAGTVNVLPQQPGGDPSGAAGGGDPSGGMDPAMMAQMMGGGGDPSGGMGGPPQQMQARRRRQGTNINETDAYIDRNRPAPAMVSLSDVRPEGDNAFSGRHPAGHRATFELTNHEAENLHDMIHRQKITDISLPEHYLKRGGRGKGRGANSPKVADVVNTYNQGWGGGKVPGLPTGNPEVDIPQYETQTGKPLGPKQRNKLTKPVSTATPMPKSKSPITTKMPKPKMSRHASFFTRKVAGWDWDDHLNGYLASKSTPFTCKCGAKHAVPSYSTCKCGKIWNSYVIGTGGDNHQASVEKFICREIPVRDNVIVANRREADCKCWKGYERVPGTKPCAEGSCRKCDSHRKKATIIQRLRSEGSLRLADAPLQGQEPFTNEWNAGPSPSLGPHGGNGSFSPDMKIDTSHAGSEDAHQIMINDNNPGDASKGMLGGGGFVGDNNSSQSGQASIPSSDFHPLNQPAIITSPGLAPMGTARTSRRKQAGGWQQLLDRRKKALDSDKNQQKFEWKMPGGMKMIKYTEDEEEPGRTGGKVKRHNLSDPGPLGQGKDDKMPDISDELGQDWYKRGPGGKYARKNRRSR
jgi:hypothetical protein